VVIGAQMIQRLKRMIMHESEVYRQSC
jgi:hypothetical protein